MEGLKSGYNYAGENERAIEVPIALHFLNLFGPDVLEIGAVLPYYPELGILTHDVLDKYDPKATIKADALNYSYVGRDVLSVSTIEHFGTTDYDKVADPKAIRNFWSKLVYARNFLLTIPFGYNKIADEFVLALEHVYYLKRVDKANNWETATKADAVKAKYDIPYKWANVIGVITNVEKYF